MIQRWFEQGLPLPSWAREKHQLGEEKPEYQCWDICPYIRHHGYGEIAVNLEIPYKKPQTGEFELIQQTEGLA